MFLQGIARRYNLKKKILIPLGIIFLGIGIYFVFFYNKAAYDRQHEQESMADEFIAYLKDNAESLDGKENGKEEAPTVNIDIPDKESAQEPSGDDTGEPAETEGEKESETLTDYTIVDGVKYLVSDSSFTDDAYPITSSPNDTKKQKLPHPTTSGSL